MQKLIPVLTEKSQREAESGKYTFWVDTAITKNQIRELVSKTFDVNVVKVWTLNIKGRTRRNARGKFVTVKPRKKAIVKLAEKQKIDLFDTKGNK